MNRRYDVCIIGGGAAGLAAAASLDRRLTTCMIEKNEILGRKVLATGGGRCNLTNAACEGAAATLDFFASMGLETFRDPEGRYYPYSGSAADVVKVLTSEAARRGVEVFTSCPVDGLAPAGGRGPEMEGCREQEAGGGRTPGTAGDGSRETGADRSSRAPASSFLVTAGGRRFEADRVILATGGKAAPQFGTVGDGYRLARSLGHRVSRLYPILTAIECGDLRDLKGIRARGRVTLLKDGSPIGSETGEIQFLEDGISGICVFNLTPRICAGPGETPAQAFRRYGLILDLAPDMTREEIAARAEAGWTSFGIVSERLAARVDLDRIKGWSLPVVGIKGWRYAQCTAGGVDPEEVDPASQESRLVPGLYLAGEILDIQGPCGGFNLQNAWETGIRAAKAINRLAGRPKG